MKNSSLPRELLQEPFNRDKHTYKPEILVRRPTTCWFSILNVYDTYGLNIAITFVKNLRNTDRLLLGYLRESYGAITRDWTRVNRLNRSVLTSSIIHNLTERDRQWPVVIGPDVIFDLPIQLVARITNSVRLSHQVTKHVWNIRRVPPTPEVIAQQVNRSSRLVLYNSEGGYSCWTMSGTLSIEVNSLGWTLSINSPSKAVPHPDRHEVLGCDLHAYHSWFTMTGLNSDREMTTLLQLALVKFSVVNESNISEACIWLLQLIATEHATISTSVRFLDLDDIRIEIAKLVAEARLLKFVE